MISIITVVKDAERDLLRTIKSVDNFYDIISEHIIIYKKSKDNTLNVIKDNLNDKRVYTEQKNTGIYEAMNLGLKNIQFNNFVLFLNAGDVLINKNFFYNLPNYKKFDIIYGITKSGFWIKDRFHKKRIEDFGEYSEKKINFGNCPSHPSFIFSRKKFKNFFFDCKYKIASDYHLMIRMLKSTNNILYYPETITLMDNNGYHSKILNRIKGNFEVLNIRHLLKLPYPYFSLIFRPTIKFMEYFKNDKI